MSYRQGSGLTRRFSALTLRRKTCTACTPSGVILCMHQHTRRQRYELAGLPVFCQAVVVRWGGDVLLDSGVLVL